MTTEQVALLKTRLKYGLYVVGIAAGLLAYGFVLPDHFVAIITGIFG
jgi:hypothetical protein